MRNQAYLQKNPVKKKKSSASSFLAQVFMGFFLLIGVVVCFTYYTFKSPAVAEHLLPLLVNSKIRDVELSSLSIGAQKFYLPDAVAFGDVKGIIRVGKDRYSFDASKVNLRLLAPWWAQDKNLKLDVVDLNINSLSSSFQSVKVSADIAIHGKHLRMAKGLAQAEKMKAQNYSFDNVVVPFEIGPDAVDSRNIRAEAYKGQIRADAYIDYHNRFSYKANIDFLKIDLKQVKESKSSFLSKIDGKLDGWVKISGDSLRVSSFQSSWNAPFGARLSAALFRYVMEYIPKSWERQKLEKLIKADGDVNVEQAAITLESEDNDRLVSKINLTSEELNLDLNLHMNISIDGGIENFLSEFYNFTK